MAEQPNIVVICSDEHHPWMTGYLDHPHVKTPVLDKMAEEGTYFTRAYCNSPICVPSRMSFITGKYAHEVKSWCIGIPMDRDEMTWGKRLHQEGIPSTLLGKMDFCGEYQDGGFTEHKIIHRRRAWEKIPPDEPWTARLKGYTRPDKRMHVHRAGPESEVKRKREEMDGNSRGVVSHYEHDRQVTDWALEYLRGKGASEESKPWALYVGYLYPHWPFCAPDEYFNMYYPDNLEIPKNAKFPNPDLHPALRHFQQALDLGEVTEDMLRRTIAGYYGMITCMDAMIGEILDELSAQGYGDNTYVVYTSDHGESLGEHGLFYKECAYEGSVGVPLIVTGPELPRGQVNDHPVSLVDLYPTVMEMAGLETEPDRSGHSWLPLIRGEEQDRPDYAFSEFHSNFLRQDWYMLVRGDYKYVYYVKERPELYNVKEDPLEDHDLAEDPAFAELLKEFEALLRTITDPEEISQLAKYDLGLLGEDGTDYTETLSVADV